MWLYTTDVAKGLLVLDCGWSPGGGMDATGVTGSGLDGVRLALDGALE